MFKMIRLVAIAALALASLQTRASDDVLLDRMVKVERAYINPLFFTSNAVYPKTRDTLVAFGASWRAFAADYRGYRPDAANWAARFDAVELALAEAEAIVFGPAAQACAATPAAPCPAVVPAHDALEAVRYELRLLRTHNGFPKFVTDKLTAYHGPMEAIVLSVKNAATIDDALLAALDEQLADAKFLWSLVERCPIDESWGFAANQRAVLEARIAAERDALSAFAVALATRDAASIRATALPIKAAFVPVYTSFAADPALNKLPAPQ